MNKEETLKNGKNRFNLYYKGEYFTTFEYDAELKRYQSEYGYLSIEKVYQLDKDLEKDRKIQWME